ncbi:MAG TPA: outer membrane protein assembly factor BamA [Rikenellaceae bacterium]|nr:outer membrane protein assembly factor BamA [Rikenellaceae bacterium]
MKRILIVSIFLMALAESAALAQQAKSSVEIDYNQPKTYVVGGIKVSGNRAFAEQQIINQSGLRKGMTVTVPSEDISAVVNRLWLQRYFQDVAVYVDSIAPSRDTAFFRIDIQERPRVSVFNFTGVKSGEKKDLLERLNFRRGSAFSDYVSKTSVDIIKRYYKEKGFLNVKVEPQVRKDTVVKNAIRVNFAVDRGEKVRIKTINFYGNTDVSDFKLAKSMKKTKSAKFYNFFSSKKFNEKEYPNDKNNMISKFQEAGYRDARIIRDSIYYVEPGRLAIDFEFDQGKKYYFRDITWTGNSVYSTNDLNEILKIKKGDPYDVVTMKHRLSGGGKQTDQDVAKIYRDNGYLFFDINPVELNITGDSVDVEIRVTEGKQATLNNIVINGNDLTSEKVVRRQIFTRPGYLFSQSDFERSIREIASLGQFDPEAIAGEGGYSIIPNQMNNTVDLVYNVTEKPSSQLELSGGWGGKTFVATVGVSFNNFSTRRLFDKSAWRPVPLGDAQNLAFRFQTSGTYYSSLSASFMEPWLFGKKPTSLSLSAYYSRQTNSYLMWNILNNDKQFEVYGFSAGLGNRLKWPDNYFVLYNQLSWQTYKLTNWYSNTFIFDDGTSHNLSYTLTLSRNSTDQQIYPRQGSDLSFSVQLTPPFSLLRKKDKGLLDANGNPTKVDSWRDINYDKWSSNDRYRWIEYHKWSFKGSLYTKLVGNLVLMTRAQFGYLGYYNRKWGYSPFEGFLVGGDGMSGYNSYGSEVIALRGYENYSLTPTTATAYNSNGYSYSGNVYDKFTVELRYPIVMQPQSTIFALLFLEGGNCWSDIRDFNPFQIKRSAGVGVRVYLPVIGLLGIDWGYGFDDNTYGKSQFHFLIGQQF